jgi:hypothetical protein
VLLGRVSVRIANVRVRGGDYNIAQGEEQAQTTCS